MKIISLNTYMGHVFDPLMTFIEAHATDTDIFCFQEMMSSTDDQLKHKEGTRRLNLLEEIQTRLPDHKVFFDATQDDFETDAPYTGQSKLGSAIFYKKDLDIRETGSFMICNTYNAFTPPDYSTLAHNALYLVFHKDEHDYLVCSIHGNSEPANKLDSPFRLEQFEKVRDFLNARNERKILMGDFNALPDTQSVKMFEKAGLKNLVHEYNIKTTRGSNMRKLFPQYEHGPYGFQEFADYTFISPEIEVLSFNVPDEPISDHLPMILSINI
jgi:endonuclease/exonuclease/phosphatase family metal-dependent hydrolase